MIVSVFLNSVFIFFPFLCYFIYIVYSKVTYEKERMIFLDLALFSSFYFCIRFNETSLIQLALLNIPVLLSLGKKRYITSVILSVGISFVLSNYYGINVFVFLIQYILINVFVIFTKIKIYNIFAVIKIIFLLIIIVFWNNDFNASSLGYAFILIVITYFMLYISTMMFNKLDLVVKMYGSLREVSREKKLYESLFKITHEIKNPLAVCKGYLDMLDVSNPDKTSRYAGIINQEIDRTLLLLKDFSSVSNLKMEKSFIDINVLLEDVCDEAKLILKNNIVFDYKLNDEEIYVDGDYNRLKQVFINVIKNAKEAIETKGKVSLKTKLFKNNYVIIIKDNGVGMNKEVEQKIGTAFYTTKKNGTGLGVCFSKEIIERHSGSIKYLSKEGKGTAVIITLPIKKASAN